LPRGKTRLGQLWEQPHSTAAIRALMPMSVHISGSIFQ
jgi:hypothetical protein